MDKWRETTLGEHCKFQEGYVNPSQRESSYFDGPVNWLRAVDLNNGPVMSTSRTLTEEGFKSAGKSAFLFPEDTLAISKSGTIGRVGILKIPAAGNRAVINVRPNNQTLNTLFAFYTLILGRDKIELLADGSVQKNLYVSALSRFKFRMPAIHEQISIVGVLDALDSKIELNRRMNETLEAMARALFKDWFVDFGPTRAKMAMRGEDPQKENVAREPYLAPEIWNLFPDRLDADGKPEGWTRKSLKDLTMKIGSGATPRGGKEVYVQDGTSLIRSQNVYDHCFSWGGLAHISDEDAHKLRNVTVEQGDVLINITGDSILRTCVVPASVLPARVNQHVSIVRASEGVPSRFLHQLLVMSRSKEILLGYDAGGSRKAITKGHLEGFPVDLPPSQILDAFNLLTAPLFARVEANEGENQSLAQLRDLLLPKLMSGEVRVAAAEKQVEAVA